MGILSLLVWSPFQMQPVSPRRPLRHDGKSCYHFVVISTGTAVSALYRGFHPSETSTLLHLDFVNIVYSIV
jgi:hypothetical protein